jgi:hypothetical protein
MALSVRSQDVDDWEKLAEKLEDLPVQIGLDVVIDILSVPRNDYLA